ncbi:MAG: alpha-keto acid decarboxylase family protein [Actinobacteria bacterium]|nr:alpha-keto acid decarboxylase family protein [Actinomycetota bacterium]
MFGVPGDFTLLLNHMLDQHPGFFVGTSDEQGAGFAADAYARLRGIGVVLATWGVGGLKLVNSTAQAWAESVPVVVICGSPGLGEREGDPLLHHKVKDFDTQMRVMQDVTEYAAYIHDRDSAPRLIAEAFATAMRECRPVYLEIPRDVVGLPCGPLPDVPPPADADPDPEVLAACLDDVQGVLGAAERPAVISGVLVARLGLQGHLDALARATGYPVAETLLGKSSVGSDDPWFKGVYAGAASSDAAVRKLFDSSDRVLVLGAYISDLNTGLFTTNIDRAETVISHQKITYVGMRAYDGVGVTHLMHGLVDRLGATLPDSQPAPRERPRFTPQPGVALSARALFETLRSRLGHGHTIIAEAGDSLFGSADLRPEESGFLATAYYASLGYAVPAALGAGPARFDRRPVVIVGDGAFQMTALEMGGMARVGVHPVVVVINNDGYATERPMMKGAFNDVPRMRYAMFPEAVGSGTGVKVDTEDGFVAALDEALADPSQLRLIEAVTPSDDISPRLRNLTAELGKRV